MSKTKSIWQRFVAVFMTLLLVLSTLSPMQAQASDTTTETDTFGARFWNDESTIGFYINSANRYLLETVPSPQFGTTAGEWSVLGLLRGMHLGYDYINHIPSNYFDGYISRFEQTVSEKLGKSPYLLDRNKSTEYSRLMLTLSSLGYDVTAVGQERAKYDFLEDLSESFKYSTRQGINGPIWEIIALNTGGYQLYDNERMQLPTDKEADINTVSKMIDFILGKEITQTNGTVGGWALSGKLPDPDITGMALQSLAPYYLNEDRFNEVKPSSVTYEEFKVRVERGIKVLAEIQEDDAGYKSWGTPNSESIAQVIVALTSLNIDPLAPSITLPTINETVSFIKGDKNVLSAILTFYAPGTGSQPWIGGFKHVTSGYDGGGGSGTTVNAMATDQATYALIAYERFKKGLNSLYDMSDMTAGQYKTLNASKYIAKFGEDTQQISPYAVIDIPSAASIGGKTFTGWNTAQDGSGIAYAAGEKLIMPEHDIVLYPMYENNPVTVVEELIAALPSDIQFTETHKLALDAASAAYENLSEQQQKLVTNYETLVEKENAYKAAEELAKANVPLVSISLKDSVIELKKDSTYQAEVIFDPANTTDDTTITWTSSDESIATVDNNGKVTAVNLGTVTITATVGQFTQTATLDVISDKPSTGAAGYVYVSFEDYAARIEGSEPFPEPLGTLIERTAVPYFEGDTIADVTVRLLDQHGIEANYWGDTESGFYLSSITNFTTPAGDYITDHNFGEFTAGQMSGWMISSNNWFINEGASEFLVEDGDIIRWQMTSQMGADIGNDWSIPSAEITGLNIDSKYGTLSPQFLEEEEYYTLTVPSDIDSIQVEALQANYWAQVTYTADGKQYKLLRDIPIQNGTQIEIYSAFAEYAGNPPSDEDWVYITIVKEEKTVIDEALQNVIDKITALPSLIAYEETHKLALDEARAAYEALNETQKMLVVNYQTLVEKENAYTALKELEEAKVPLTAISVKEEVITLTVGDMYTAEVAFSPENTTDSKALEYETSDASIVHVENGVLTAVAKGQATVTVKAANGLTATIAVTVQAKPKAPQPPVVDQALQNTIDKITALPSLIAYEETHKLALDEARAAYDALTETQKMLVANYQTLVEKENAYKALKEIEEAKVLLTAISVKETAITLTVGDTHTAEIAFSPENTTDSRALEYETSDTSIVRVENGVLTAVAKGQATVTVKAANGLTATISVTVQDTPAPAIVDKATKSVIDQIAALPSNITADVTHKVALTKVRVAYDKLTLEQQLQVTNYQTLVEKENAYKASLPQVKGYVYISLEDFGVRVIGDEGDYPTPLGMMLSRTKVPFYAGDTIADVTVRFLTDNKMIPDHWGTTKSGFYLATIDNVPYNGSTIDEFGEFSAGAGSGWMITWNNWFINMGASQFLVEDGDIIKWQYTSQLGADIGSDWANPSAAITGLNIASKYGQLSPSFKAGVKDYTLTVPKGTTAIQLEALQANYWAKVTYKANGQTYKVLRDIPVQVGTVIEISSEFKEFVEDPSPSDTDKITITIAVEGEEPSKNPGTPEEQGKNPEALEKPGEKPGTPEVPNVNPGTPEAPSVNPGTPEVPSVNPGTPEVPSVNPGTPEAPSVNPGTPEVPSVNPGTPEVPSVNPGTSEAPSVNPGTLEVPSVNPETPGTSSGSVPVSPSNPGQDEKPDVTKAEEVNKVDNKQQTTVNVAATPEAVVTVQSEEGIQITIPKAALQVETVDVLLQVTPQGMQISFASEGKEISLKKYAEVAIPAEVLSPKNGAVLLRRLPDGSLVATPYTVLDGQFVLKTATSGEFVLSTDNKTFKDIEKDGHKSYIEELAKRHIVNGKTEEIYDPTAGMTRGQFSAMLVRALDLHAEKEQQFQDAKASSFAQELQALVEIGVLKGDGNQLKPGATITRNQAALMIERLFTYLELDLPEVSVEELNFTDVEKIAESSKKSVALMQKLGIFTGKEDGRFDPNGQLTRSQMAKVIYKALTYAKMM